MRNGGIRNVRSFVSRSRYERKGTMCEEGRGEKESKKAFSRYEIESWLTR